MKSNKCQYISINKHWNNNCKSVYY